MCTSLCTRSALITLRSAAAPVARSRRLKHSWLLPLLLLLLPQMSRNNNARLMTTGLCRRCMMKVIGWQSTFSVAAQCPALTCSPSFRSTWRCAAPGMSLAATTAQHVRHGWRIRTATGGISCPYLSRWVLLAEYLWWLPETPCVCDAAATAASKTRL